MINDGKCPYCFKQIDEKDLAYELHFYDGYTEEDLHSDLLRSFVKMREDRKFRQQWGAENRSCERYMLYESHRGRKEGREVMIKNGMERLLHRIAAANESAATVPQEELEEEFSADYDYEDEDYEEESLVLVEAAVHRWDYSYTLLEDGEEKVLAWPCCPQCHTMLPIGWFQAEDFLPISLIAPVAGGKTTFILSLIGDNQKQLNIGNDLHFTVAHHYTDPFYKEIKEAAENLYHGKYPKHTPRLLQSPVFFNLEYQKHNLMVGIYDASG